MTTHEKLIVLRGLDGPVLGQALDNLDGFVELGLGHGWCVRQCASAGAGGLCASDAGSWSIEFCTRNLIAISPTMC
jgi:hypothetical protein